MNPHCMNPAGRLFEFLNFVWSQPDQLPASAAWAQYLLPGADKEQATFFKAVGIVLTLPREIRASVALLPPGPFASERLLRALPAAEAALSIAPQLSAVTVSQMKAHYDRGTLADLEMCSELLSHGRPGVGQEIQDEDEPSLDAIRRLANEIQEEATESGLPQEVAALLWRNADAIVRAVDLYRILGQDGVIREFEGLVGSLVTKPAAFSAVQKSSSLREKIQRLSKEIIVLGAACAVPTQLIIEASNFWTAVEPHVTALSTVQP
ncbi:hypothetical protein [Cryobacterium zhongshanensis]|uniref:Uncharacterized protein n=1 Tax=Cryobacterium zhongshanensis TaxID=2928153 RepID=A0AA41QVX8_9MICO|nr:hypothetical protein [Cryobacterium zhongshanensis]MCI4657136.1 hypothetical protein [Cryobacterium zhongshanensis]